MSQPTLSVVRARALERVRDIVCLVLGMRVVFSWTLTAWLAVGAGLLVASGCARSDWIDQTLVTVDVTGRWMGTSSGRGGGSYSGGGTVELTLQQNGPKVTGRYRAAGGGAPIEIEGTVAGDHLNLSATRGAWKAVLLVNGDQMDGSESSWYGTRNLSLQRDSS